MKWAGTAASCVATGAAGCLALREDVVLLLNVSLCRLVTAGEHANRTCTRWLLLVDTSLLLRCNGSCGAHGKCSQHACRNAVRADVVLTLKCCGNRNNELRSTPGGPAECPTAELANSAHSVRAAVPLTGVPETASC